MYSPDYYNLTYIITKPVLTSHYLQQECQLQYMSNLTHSSLPQHVTCSVFPVLVDGLTLTLSPKSESCDSSLTSPLFSMKKIWISFNYISYLCLQFTFLIYILWSTLIISPLKFWNSIQMVPQNLVLILYKSNFHTDAHVKFLKDKSVHRNNV